MSKYKDWITKDGLFLISNWAQEGMTDEQIAKKIGIGDRTLYDWKKRYPQFSQALKKGKEYTDYAVQSALLQKAVSGDTTAMIFWLKNRMPDKWRDRPLESEKNRLTQENEHNALIDAIKRRNSTDEV